MKAVTLFKEGSHITDVTVQYKGEIAVGSGGVGGEHYIRIPAQERPKLLSALADASGNSLPDEMSDELSDETTVALFRELFGDASQDPYVDIQRFLRAKNVAFKGEYWPSR